MTDDPILEVPGYTPPEPKSAAEPRAGFLIDDVPFSPQADAPAAPIPARAAGFIDSVPLASATVWSDAPVATPANVAGAQEATTTQVPPPDVAAPDVAPPAVAPPNQPVADLSIRSEPVPDVDSAGLPLPDAAAPLSAAIPAVGSAWASEPTQPVAPGATEALEPGDDPFADWLAVPVPEVSAPEVPAPATLEHIDDVDVTRRVQLRVPTVTLTWDDGTATYVTTPTLVGRNPTSAGSDLAVAIADTTLSLSKTHARLMASPPSIEDLDSTNGVAIERAGQRVDLPPRQATSLAPGDVLYFGNRRAVVEVVS